MAHEINNPLTYIKMSLDLLQEGLEETTVQGDWRRLDHEVYEELNDAIHDAIEGVDRVSHIVKSLLSIAQSGGRRGSNESMSTVRLIEVAKACASLVKPEFSKGIELLIEVDHKLSVMGKRPELIQVLLNLLINAAQAMPKDRLSGHQIKVASSMLSSGEIQLTVSDNAQGIPGDDLDRIFEPFFSSKPVGEGTGLGLAVSRGILEAHQATISVSSIEGEGTTFIITFPKVHPSDAAEDPGRDLSRFLGNEPINSPDSTPVSDVLNKEEAQELASYTPIGQRRILIVDDDVLVAKSFAKMLRQNIVVTASSGTQALKILASSQFDLILSDVMMPIMDGPAFYQEVSVRFPRYQERFIFITGATKNSEVTKAINETERLILSKPITKSQLLSAVNNILTNVSASDDC
jgi:CheY-like chemotaxis protein